MARKGRRVSALAAVVVLAGCAGKSGITTQSVNTAPSSTIAQSVTTLPATTLPATTVAPLKQLVLEPDGLGLVPFGTSRPAALAALAAMLGKPDRTGPGCGEAGRVTSADWKDLTVEFLDGSFASYAVGPRPSTTATLGLMTRAGIGLGSTAAALKQTYGTGVKIPGGLPPELGGKDFAVSLPGATGSIKGTLSSISDGGRVVGFFTAVCG